MEGQQEEQMEVQENEMSMNSSEKNSFGPVFGIILIIVLLALGGFYLWGKKLNEQRQNMTAEDILNQEDNLLSNLQKQGASDEITDIETDLNAIDLNGLDAELKDIDKELSL